MKNKIKFSELRQLLLNIGFKEKSLPDAAVFYHKPSDTVFAFRPYQLSDPVADYNLMEVKGILDARGFMSEENFENQFRKTPA